MKSRKEISLYWKSNAEYLEGLKGKTDLSPTDWKAIVYETWAICANSGTPVFAGGTISSQNFIVTSAHLKLLESLIEQPAEFREEHPTLDELVHLTTKTIEEARDGLVRHNSQSSRFEEYDLVTGEPIDTTSEMGGV